MIIKNLENKKAQVTIFIIIGIVIVAAIVLYFLFFNSTSNEKIVSPEIKLISDFVSGCAESVGTDAIYFVGTKGGYYASPELSTSTGVPIYVSDENNFAPSKEQVENSVSSYVNENLANCIRDFSDFPEYSIVQGNISTKTTIDSDSVRFEINYPLAITKNNATSEIKIFNAEVPLRLGVLYDSSKELVKERIEYNADCLTCMNELTSEKNIKIDMYDFDNLTSVYVLSDNLQTDNHPLGFVFALRN